MSEPTVKVGILMLIGCPLVIFVLAGFSSLIPGCNVGGSAGPAFGYQLWSLANELANRWAAPVIVFYFLTIPLDLLVTLIGALLAKKLLKRLALRCPTLSLLCRLFSNFTLG